MRHIGARAALVFGLAWQLLAEEHGYNSNQTLDITTLQLFGLAPEHGWLTT